jgi:LPS-assembly lipoprotein
LAGCGFHLRQAPDQPPSMRKIYVAAAGHNGQLLRQLRRSLASDQTEVLDTPVGATTTLSIINVQQASLPLAVDDNGNPVEYQVTYTVEFALIVQDVTVLEPQVVTLTRNYAYSVANAVANQEQEQILGDAMAKDAAQFISFRVAAAAKNLPPYVATSAAPTAASRPTATPVPVAATAKPPVR